MEIFKIEKNYTVPIDLVWQAITDRAMMKEWYFDFAEDFKLEPGPYLNGRQVIPKTTSGCTGVKCLK